MTNRCLALFLLVGLLLSSCSKFNWRDGLRGSPETKASPKIIQIPIQKIKEDISRESSELIGYQIESNDNSFSFNIFAANEPIWDKKIPFKLLIPLGKDIPPIQCSFAKRNETLGTLLSRVELNYPFIGMGQIRPGHYRGHPWLYVEKLYDKPGHQDAYAVKMMGVRLEGATYFCLHQGSGYKKSFFTAMDELGKTIEFRAEVNPKALLSTSLWALRLNNYPRGLIIEKAYRRPDGLKETIREQSEIFESDSGSESIYQKIVQIKDDAQEGVLMFFQGQRNGRTQYELAFKREGINAYRVKGMAEGKKVDYLIESHEKIPDLDEERLVMASKVKSFAYSTFSPRYNPIALSQVHGQRFGDPKIQCLYMVRKPEGFYEYRCDNEGKVIKFLPKKALLNSRYSGRLFYENEISKPFK